MKPPKLTALNSISQSSAFGSNTSWEYDTETCVIPARNSDSINEQGSEMASFYADYIAELNGNRDSTQATAGDREILDDIPNLFGRCRGARDPFNINNGQLAVRVEPTMMVPGAPVKKIEYAGDFTAKHIGSTAEVATKKATKRCNSGERVAGKQTIIALKLPEFSKKLIEDMASAEYAPPKGTTEYTIDNNYDFPVYKCTCGDKKSRAPATCKLVKDGNFRLNGTSDGNGTLTIYHLGD